MWHSPASLSTNRDSLRALEHGIAHLSTLCLGRASVGVVTAQRPTRVGNTLQRVLQRIDPDQRMNAFRVWTFWDEEVGDALARHAQPAGFRAGVLSVRVDSTTWMQELSFLKEGIRERLNRRLGEELIRDIYFVTGKVTEPSAREGEAEASTATAAAANRRLPLLPRLNNPEVAALFERIARAHAAKR